MLKIAEIQFQPWDKVYDFNIGDNDVNIGDSVLVKTELGIEIGKIVGTKLEKNDQKYQIIIDTDDEDDVSETSEEAQEIDKSKQKLRTIIRKASGEDLDIVKKNEKQKVEALEYCNNIVKRTSLSMKLIDAHVSFDGGRVTIAFISEGRVDFRDLVKEMSRHFQRSIRMQQLGVRDEAKAIGDAGPCGRKLCCKSHLKDLGGVSSDLAVNQQVAHRGSDRLSGSCGRLMCCLRYENENYVNLMKNMPQIGTEMNTPQGRGKVIGWHTLKQTVDVQIGVGKTRVIVEMEVGSKK